jgi:hypothetical protein
MAVNGGEVRDVVCYRVRTLIEPAALMVSIVTMYPASWAYLP